METIILFILILVLIGIIAYLVLSNKKPSDSVSQTALQQISQNQTDQLQRTTELLLHQLTKQQESQDRTSTMVHTRIDQATRVVSAVQGKLLQLEESHKQIFELGKNISSLQQILQAPKLRGGMGEVWLEDLIGQIIPSGHFKMQHRFKTGEICDAVIFLRDGVILPIDSKFSLENFVRMMEAPDDQKSTHSKQFSSDVKKRIDEIAKKYILPDEGTLDFAFMYVPAENVYYQAFIAGEDLSLLQYAFSRKVIPVSPSSFYAYLQVILFGLKGMEIEKSAKDIQKNLSGLHGEFEKFRETYEKVGVHLRHAQQSYDMTDKRLDKVDTKFTQIAQSEQPLLDSIENTPVTSLND